MKLRTFALLASIVTFVFGLGLLLIPTVIMGLYGIDLKFHDSETYICRYLGSALFGTSVVWFLARKVEDFQEALAAIILGAITLSLTGFLVGLADAIWGAGNGLVWINPLIYILLTIGFVFFYFRHKI